MLEQAQTQAWLKQEIVQRGAELRRERVLGHGIEGAHGVVGQRDLLDRPGRLHAGPLVVSAHFRDDEARLLARLDEGWIVVQTSPLTRSAVRLATCLQGRNLRHADRSYVLYGR